MHAIYPLKNRYINILWLIHIDTDLNNIDIKHIPVHDILTAGFSFKNKHTLIGWSKNIKVNNTITLKISVNEREDHLNIL